MGSRRPSHRPPAPVRRLPKRLRPSIRRCRHIHRPALLDSPDGLQTLRGDARSTQAARSVSHLLSVSVATQNAYIESFNGRFRDECLAEHWFTGVAHAQVVIETWRREYNEDRPKKGLGGLTPAAYAQQLTGHTSPSNCCSTVGPATPREQPS